MQFDTFVLKLCIALTMISFLSVTLAYAVPSRYWARMFHEFVLRDDQVLGLPACAEWKNPFDSGWLIEMLRAGLCIWVGFYVVAAGVFRGELMALIPRRGRPVVAGGQFLPWYRGASALLAITITVYVVLHHVSWGPLTLWQCNGNPALQHIPKKNSCQYKKYQDLPADDPQKMNAIPSDKDQMKLFRSECRVPYLFYFAYSLINFLVLGSLMSVSMLPWYRLRSAPGGIRLLWPSWYS